MDKKTSFIMYPAEFLAAIHNFKKNQTCDLIVALCEFNLYGSLSFKLPLIVQERFDAIQSTININNAKYAEICEKRKANGSKGGSKRQAKTKQNAVKSNTAPPLEEESEQESVIENDLKKDRETKIGDKSVYPGAPSVADVTTYCQESGYTIDPVAFVNWNEKRGWMNGKKYIALDWKKAVRKWFCKENGLSYSEIESMANICGDMLSKMKAGSHDKTR